MNPQDPASVLAGGARLAAETGRVCGVANRQLVRLEDLVAVEIRNGDLGGWHKVQVVARDDIHEVFLVGYLAGPAGGGGIDQRGRPNFRHAVFSRVDVEHEVDQGALEA